MYDDGLRDLRMIVRAIYERVNIEWCSDGEDPEDVVAHWLCHKRFISRNGHQLVAPREI